MTRYVREIMKKFAKSDSHQLLTYTLVNIGTLSPTTYSLFLITSIIVNAYDSLNFFQFIETTAKMSFVLRGRSIPSGDYLAVAISEDADMGSDLVRTPYQMHLRPGPEVSF
jgi:hypothetical protein